MNLTNRPASIIAGQNSTAWQCKGCTCDSKDGATSHSRRPNLEVPGPVALLSWLLLLHLWRLQRTSEGILMVAVAVAKHMAVLHVMLCVLSGRLGWLWTSCWRGYQLCPAFKTIPELVLLPGIQRWLSWSRAHWSTGPLS